MKNMYHCIKYHPRIPDSVWSRTKKLILHLYWNKIKLRYKISISTRREILIRKITNFLIILVDFYNAVGGFLQWARKVLILLRNRTRIRDDAEQNKVSWLSFWKQNSLRFSIMNSKTNDVPIKSRVFAIKTYWTTEMA